MNSVTNNQKLIVAGAAAILIAGGIYLANKSFSKS